MYLVQYKCLLQKLNSNIPLPSEEICLVCSCMMLFTKLQNKLLDLPSKSECLRYFATIKMEKNKALVINTVISLCLSSKAK